MFSQPSMATLIVVGIIGLAVLIFTTAYGLWRVRGGQATEDESSSVKCRFIPGRVKLHGHRGEVLRVSARIEGPSGLTFATFVEEPWIVATPSSGMVPEDVQVEIHTAHAPEDKRQNITLRVLPIDGQVPCENLSMDIRLKPARGAVAARIHG